MQMKNKRHPLRRKEGYVCNSPVSFHGLTLVKANIPSTSSTVWLTKAVDIAVSYPVHVVAYTVPACPADAN